MKIRVSLNFKTNTADSALEIVASPVDIVASIKDKVSSAQSIPFPEQELSLGGVVLANDAKLSACGVREGSILKLDVKATEATLAQQLAELLKARDLSPDELGLLYCYKHGVSVSQALKLVGCEGKLQDFIDSQKSFLMDSGCVTLAKKDTSLKPVSVVDEVVQILKANGSGPMDIKELCAKFVQKFGVGLASMAGCKPLEFLNKEKAIFAVHGRGLVSLQGSQKAAPTANSPSAISVSAPPGLQSTDTAGSVVVELESVDGAQYLELHNKISSRPFNSKVTQVLNDLVTAVSGSSFLDIDHVVTGGSVGKGTAIVGVATVEVVLFVRALPLVGQETWLPPLLRAVAGALAEDARAAQLVEGIRVAEDSVQMRTRGSTPITVDLYISPAFDSHAQTIQVLGGRSPDVRRLYAPSFAKERTQFVARQPSSVKVTMRLVKWWRDQQEWYGSLARPSDELLELAAIYSAIQTKPSDQKVAIANLMSLLSRFDQMRVVWSNYYSKDDVWAPLLRQRPLLMDPTNPFVNVADPQIFDASELVVLARTTRFFW